MQFLDNVVDMPVVVLFFDKVVDVSVVQMLGYCLRDVEQIVASCHRSREIVKVIRDVELVVAPCRRSFEIVEVTAGAGPVVVDVAVIMQ